LPETFLIVGLGNPGKEYALTRHNVGFLVAQRLAEKHGWKLSSDPHVNGLVAQGPLEGRKVVILLPLTFMNNSGVAVSAAVRRQEVLVENIFVVVDDFTLDLGDLRVRRQGSDGGHNGLKSLIAHLGTKDFARLRIGVGPQPDQDEAIDFVLGEFKLQEKKQLPDIISRGCMCCEVWLSEGINKAMSQFNKRKEND